MVWYLIGGLVFLFYTFTLVKGKYSADRIIHGYMIVAPLYNFYIMLTFWNNSIGNFVNLFPLPLAAYVFFQKKEFILYTLYAIINIAVCFLVYKYSGFQFAKYNHREVSFADAVLFVFNFINIILILIYNNKINKLKILAEVESKKVIRTEKKSIKAIVPEVTIEKDRIKDDLSEGLFEKIEEIMNTEELYKNPKLNIAMLSTTLETNYTHLSKAINYKGYSNFNNYLNVHRVNHVKQLIDEGNLQKTTLMYVYTEAGFSNQATFNRVFKQIEGITPSEYISNTQKTEELDQGSE